MPRASTAWATARRARRSPRSSGASASRRTAAESRWRRSRAGCSRRSRSRAPHEPRAAPARRADDRPRPALEAGGAAVHLRDPHAARLDDPALHPRHEGGRGPRRPGRAPRPRAAALPRAGRGREGAVRGRDARGGVLRRHRPQLRGREEPGGRGAGGVRVMALMQTTTQAIRHELVGLGGVVERNWYLVKRYIWWELAFFLWTAANTLTIVFIAK